MRLSHKLTQKFRRKTDVHLITFLVEFSIGLPNYQVKMIETIMSTPQAPVL